jgi:hypothetical protein
MTSKGTFAASIVVTLLLLAGAPARAYVRTTYLYHDTVPNYCLGVTQFCTSPNAYITWASNDPRGYPILVGSTWPHTGYDTASTHVKDERYEAIAGQYYLTVETFVAATADYHADNLNWEFSWVGRFG